MAKYRWGIEHLFHYVANGKPLDGIVYLPDGFNPKQKYPMLIYIYERFSDDLHGFHSPGPGTSPNLLRYVSNGYVVMVPDIAYGTGHPGQDGLHAVNAAIDTIVARGYVDPKHIGIAGHSWGAYQIAYMVTQTHRFAAVEAGAAVSDGERSVASLGQRTGRDFNTSTASRVWARRRGSPGSVSRQLRALHVERADALPHDRQRHDDASRGTRASSSSRRCDA